MAAAFDDVRLPIEIEQGSTGGPSFSTSIVKMASGQEVRNQNWQGQLMVYDVGYGLTSAAETDGQDFYTLMKFFYARRGRARAFRFKDWTDFQATAEPCAVIDSSHVQLQKTYSDIVSFSRKITRPVIGSLVMFDSTGTLIAPSNYTADFTTGIVTGSGLVSASFQFDVPVRFDTDVFTLTIQLFNAAEIQSLNIVEIRE